MRRTGAWSMRSHSQTSIVSVECLILNVVELFEAQAPASADGTTETGMGLVLQMYYNLELLLSRNWVEYGGILRRGIRRIALVENGKEVAIFDLNEAYPGRFSPGISFSD